ATGNGTGAEISGSLDGVVTGSSTTGTGAHVSDGAHIAAGGSVTGTSDSGSGTVVEGHISNNGEISGTSDTGDGLNINAAVSGGGTLSGNSVNGAGVHVSGDSSMEGGRLSGSTTNGAGISLDGDLKHTPDSTINIHVVPGGAGQKNAGQGSVIEVKPSPEPDSQTGKMMREISRQQAVLAQTPGRGSVLQRSGYRTPDEPVELEICVDGNCQSANVDRQPSSGREGSDRGAQKAAGRQ
ncbi:TPA: hypothetical protein ACTDLJ_004395, partial [Salmonella enterica subsp. enterica serovar Newport]